MTSKTEPAGPETDFGYTTIPRDAKKPMVRAVFDSVARRYDVMNDLMSLGIHRAWKRDFVAGLDPRPNRTLLDLAGGTGDITFAWLGRGGGPALLTDINEQMLAVAATRATKLGLHPTLTVADAETLPFPDASVDRVTIAFGLRNWPRDTRSSAILSRLLSIQAFISGSSSETGQDAPSSIGQPCASKGGYSDRNV